MSNYTRDIFRYAVKVSHSARHDRDPFEGQKKSKRGRLKLYIEPRNPHTHHNKHTNMKRTIVRIVMIAAWITGVGFSYLALATEAGTNEVSLATPMSTLYWALPLAVLGLAYFVLNIYWAQRRHNLKRMI